jgi:AcrR family transcriptional regulator
MTVKRAAHRPSRKRAVIEAAMRLYATTPREDISVADIAAAANLTAAALYYHYPTKEDVLLDGLTGFADVLIEQVSVFLFRNNGSPQGLPLHLLDWLAQHHDSAVVWFVHSNGLSIAVEACRRATNDRLLTEIINAVRSTSRGFSLPHASVIAAALLAEVEVSARAWLVNDGVCVAGREAEFRCEVTELSANILSVPAPA